MRAIPCHAMPIIINFYTKTSYRRNTRDILSHPIIMYSYPDRKLPHHHPSSSSPPPSAVLILILSPFLNIPYTLFCPLCAVDIFENRASGNLFPALRLCKTLDSTENRDFFGVSGGNSLTYDPDQKKEMGRWYVREIKKDIPLHTHVFDAATANSLDLLLDLPGR